MQPAMFLLNSRPPLVTATCGFRNRRHPFSRSYGANLPISLGWVVPDTPEPPQLGAPVSVLGTVVRAPSEGGFSRAPGWAGLRHHAFTPFSPLRHSGGFSAWTPRRRCPAYPEASPPRQRHTDGAGILTGFPFGRVELRTPLGPANPRLTNIAEEPWPLRRSGFSPDYAATTARILVPAWSTRAHARASAHAGRPPTGSPRGAPGYRRSA